MIVCARNYWSLKEKVLLKQVIMRGVFSLMFSVVREYIHTIHFLNAVEIFSGTEQMCASFLNNAARAKIIGSFVLYIHAAYIFSQARQKM